MTLISPLIHPIVVLSSFPVISEGLGRPPYMYPMTCPLEGGQVVDVALSSLAEALSGLQSRHHNRLFFANVVLFRGPEQASSSETEAG